MLLQKIMCSSCLVIVFVSARRPQRIPGKLHPEDLVTSQRPVGEMELK